MKADHDFGESRVEQEIKFRASRVVYQIFYFLFLRKMTKQNLFLII
jgi:hypothetical protein